MMEQMNGVNQTEVYTVGILGATGAVGQRFVSLLSSHPSLKISHLGASERSAGKAYSKAVNWKLSEELDERVGSLMVLNCDDVEKFKTCDIIFSGLDASVAGPIELSFAERGFCVFSNAKNHRYDPHVPILIPFVNPEHIHAVRRQPSYIKSKGFIVTNANCASTGLSVALRPLRDLYGGISQMFVTTLQAISGAGYPGIPSLDILDNVVPFISGEEEKLELEPNKILGHFKEEKEDGRVPEDSFNHLNINISAACHRVPVTDGHTVTVSIKFNEPISRPVPTPAPKDDELINLIKSRLGSFAPLTAVQQLPSCPSNSLIVKEESDRPQPRMDRGAGNGMSTVVGRVRRCNIFDIKMTVVSHNTILGAAGGSILNAELAIKEGLVSHKST